jgi:hypothetical protein
MTKNEEFRAAADKIEHIASIAHGPTVGMVVSAGGPGSTGLVVQPGGPGSVGMIVSASVQHNVLHDIAAELRSDRPSKSKIKRLVDQATAALPAAAISAVVPILQGVGML